jgi:hypothetical protein
VLQLPCAVLSELVSRYSDAITDWQNYAAAFAEIVRTGTVDECREYFGACEALRRKVAAARGAVESHRAEHGC